MPKLNHHGTQLVLKFLRDLYVFRSWEDLTTHVIHSIPTLISTDICSCNDMSSRRRYATYRGWPDNHPTIPDAAAILGRFAHQHPLLTYMERTKDLTRHKITDFVSQRQFRTTALYNEYYRPLQLPYNMGACIAVTKDSTLAIGLNRIKRDFSDQDLAILDLLRPHLTQAYDNARIVTTIQEQLAAMRLTMEEGQDALLYICARWASPLGDFFG